MLHRTEVLLARPATIVRAGDRVRLAGLGWVGPVLDVASPTEGEIELLVDGMGDRPLTVFDDECVDVERLAVLTY